MTSTAACDRRRWVGTKQIWRIKKVDTIWLDGQLVPWDSATEHVLAHTMHYGVGAFEGIRAYQRADGKTQIFRLREHIDRLLDSLPDLHDGRARTRASS